MGLAISCHRADARRSRGRRWLSGGEPPAKAGGCFTRPESARYSTNTSEPTLAERRAGRGGQEESSPRIERRLDVGALLGDPASLLELRLSQKLRRLRSCPALTTRLRPEACNLRVPRVPAAPSRRWPSCSAAVGSRSASLSSSLRAPEPSRGRHSQQEGAADAILGEAIGNPLRPAQDVSCSSLTYSRVTLETVVVRVTL